MFAIDGWFFARNRASLPKNLYGKFTNFLSDTEMFVEFSGQASLSSVAMSAKVARAIFARS